MELLVKAYLRNHSFQQLEDEHGVCARPNKLGDKFSLNYDMILVKNGDPVSEQCRGLVIRPRHFPMAVWGDQWKDVRVGEIDVLAWPMNRFYNFGDHAAADVDWSDHALRVYEKLDGTMMVVYWDEQHGVWHAGTRSVPEADLPIRMDHMEIGNTTFSEMFWKAAWITLARNGVNVPVEAESAYEACALMHEFLDHECTYVFELTTPFNRIVVKYEQPCITLLAVRHTKTGEEHGIEGETLPQIPLPTSWSLRDPHAVAAFVDSADPAKLEGAVVCDSQFRRMKVKNKTWVLSSKAKDMVTVSRRSALEAIILGKIDDVIPLLTEQKVIDDLLMMQSGFAKYCKSVDENYKAFHKEASGSRKHFAEQVMLSGDWTPAYFNMWTGKSTSTLDWIRTMCETGKLSTGSLDTILACIAK